MSILTAAQLATVVAVRQRWGLRRLATTAAERPQAEASVRRAYLSVGAAEPRHIFWVDSPTAGFLMQSAAPRIIAERSEGGPPQKRRSVPRLTDSGRFDGMLNEVEWAADPGLRAELDCEVDEFMKQTFWSGNLEVLWDAVGNDPLRPVGWGASIASDGPGGWPTAATVDAYAHLGLCEPSRWNPQLDVLRHCLCWWPHRSFAVLCDRPRVIHLDSVGRLHNDSGPAVEFRDGWSVFATHGTRRTDVERES